MAELKHQPAVPNVAPMPRPVRDAEDLTHQRQGPLGNTSVVPDDYVGPMPPGTLRETDYRRMEKVYGNIESGNSSIRFDTSSFFKDEAGKDLSLMSDPLAYLKAMGEAGQFRQQYMGYMQELVKTPAGLQLLEQLDSSKHSTTIQHGVDGNLAEPKDNEPGHLTRDGRPGAGTDVTVTGAPSQTEWDGETCHQGKQPWMEDRPKFGFYHELVHAYHFNRGTNELDGHNHAACVTEYPHEIAKKEFQAVGLGPYQANAVSENAIRAQMGAPLRPTYSGTAWDDPDPWAQKKDAEEPPRRSPAR